MLFDLEPNLLRLVARQGLGHMTSALGDGKSPACQNLDFVSELDSANNFPMALNLQGRFSILVVSKDMPIPNLALPDPLQNPRSRSKIDQTPELTLRSPFAAIALDTEAGSASP